MNPPTQRNFAIGCLTLIAVFAVTLAAMFGAKICYPMPEWIPFEHLLDRTGCYTRPQYYPDTARSRLQHLTQRSGPITVHDRGITYFDQPADVAANMAAKHDWEAIMLEKLPDIEVPGYIPKTETVPAIIQLKPAPATSGTINVIKSEALQRAELELKYWGEHRAILINVYNTCALVVDQNNPIRSAALELADDAMKELKNTDRNLERAQAEINRLTNGH